MAAKVGNTAISAAYVGGATISAMLAQHKYIHNKI